MGVPFLVDGGRDGSMCNDGNTLTSGTGLELEETRLTSSSDQKAFKQ